MNKGSPNTSLDSSKSKTRQAQRALRVFLKLKTTLRLKLKFGVFRKKIWHARRACVVAIGFEKGNDGDFEPVFTIHCSCLINS